MRTTRLLLALGCAWIGVRTAQADDTVKLRLADPLPVTHYMSVEGAKVFMARATELSHGRITFEYYPSEQLGQGRDMLRLLQTSVTDIAYVAPSYVSDRMPLSGVAELPGLYDTACQGTHGFYALARGGILDQQEFKPNGVVALMAWNLGPYQVNSRLPALHALSDFAGLKIRGPGGVWDLILRQLKASPVNFPVSELRVAMERGTVDASIGPAMSLKPYDLLSVVKSMTQGGAFGSFAATYSINARKFHALPPDLQSDLVQAGKEATEHLCEYADTHEQIAQREAVAAGVKPWVLTPAEQQQVRDVLAPVVTEWTRLLDARHLPATQVVQDFRAAAK